MALVGLPIAFFLATTGLGLLAERAAGARLPNGLLAPLGFCVATALLLATFRLGAGLAVACAVLVAGAAAGFALARSQLRARLNPGWPGLAGLAVYGLYAAPVLLSGNWTWSGYNFLNDTAVQFLLIDHLKTSGIDLASLPLTTGGVVIGTYFNSGYPIGTHAFVATLSGLLGSPPEVIYQPYVAAMAALAAMALAVLAGRTLFTARTGAIVGAVAMAANLTYNTGLQGSIKEIGVIAALAAAAALARELVAGERPVALAALLGSALAGILSVYSAAGVPYVGALLGTLALVVLLAHGREALRARWIAAGAATCVVMALMAAPSIAAIIDFYRVTTVVVGTSAPAGDVLGQLAAPLPLLQAAGIWLDGAYHTPMAPSTGAARATSLGLWVVAILALVSVAEIARRRRPELLLVLVPAALTAAVVAPGVVPYADAKLLAIMSPSVVIAAAVGLLALSRVLRPAGPALAAGLAVTLSGAIALSDAYAVHDSKIAPRERLLALREAADHLAGRDGLVMFNEFEEFAKYFGAGAALNATTESITPRQVQLRQPSNQFGRFFDLDLQTLDYVEGFSSIIMRRSPAASRPPARYRRVFANRFYEAWTRGTGPRTLAHLPLQRLDDATVRAPCADVRALVQRARRGSGDAVLVAARAPAAARLDVLAAERSFAPDEAIPGTVRTIEPGHARGRVMMERSGTYRVWVRGSFPRATHVLVDGERRLTVEGTNTPGQWLGDVGLRLSAGAHAVEVRVPGGALKPGDGAAVTIGPVVFVADDPPRLETVPLSRWRSLCGRELDWIELVRPDRAGSDG